MFSVQAPPSSRAAPPPMDDQPWYATFPTPTSSLANGTLASMTPSQLREEMVRQPRLESRDFLVVDVRRTDFEVAFIRGAVNLPAHSFYPTLDSLFPFLSSHKRVVFHCQSSSGRGPRTAAWYQDRLNERGVKPNESVAVVLSGGIKAWIEEFGLEDAETVKL